MASKRRKLQNPYDETKKPPTTFKIVAGSYEKLLYGLEGTVTMSDGLDELQFDLSPVFIFPAHVSCIKAIAASPHGGKWLATGSTDEIIKIWDLKRRKEVGGLMHHQGSITHLSFPSRSHLISASEDGTLCLFHARDWTVLRILRGHKARVNAVAVHPSGKVALSVGKDKTLRMWDLMRGKGVASTKLDKEGETVRWSIDGTMFAVQLGSRIDIYATNMTLLQTITHPSRVHDILFFQRNSKRKDEPSSEMLLVGAEDHKLSVYNVPDSSDPGKQPRIVAEMLGHSNRIKAVTTLEISLPSSSTFPPSTTIVCTASSDGFINLYDAAEVPAMDTPNESIKQIKPLTSYDSKGTRFTCLALADGGDLDDAASLENGRRKSENEAYQDEDEDGDWDQDTSWRGVGEQKGQDTSEGEEDE